MKLNSRHGFTLIELLVVIAIISLLSTLIYASLNDARRQARNAAKLELIGQYRIAHELVHTASPTGEYVNTGDELLYCIGHVPPGRTDCGIREANNTPIPESAAIITQLGPQMPGLPSPNSNNLAIPISGLGTLASAVYQCHFNSFGRCATATIYWALEGGSQKCGPGLFWGGNTDFTVCVLDLK
jgi:prepilin-type N-terminal cleavage/methylation domain-containing protein